MKDFWIVAGTIVFVLLLAVCSKTAMHRIYGEPDIKTDTIVVFAPDYDILKQNDILLYQVDSLSYTLDSIKVELELANFKLERIRYYNTIAANNNNIKYLRGWINRVFNE